MLELLWQYLLFLRKTKKYWMLPLIVILVIISLVLVGGEGSVIAPFIYALW